MSNVKTLPPEIVSKIAAGEVIERPASVIKELMENAIDANAQSIETSLKQAGKTLINIKDTGVGIAQDDIKTIFNRHSTSKIRTMDDLFNIRSLGFRGEALYSIAAISDVTLRSKTESQDTGWEIHVRDTKQLDLRPVSMPTGTELEIKELFFNTPARRKFLKSNTTEMHQILNIFIPYALLYPEKRFLLRHQDKNVLNLNPDTSLVERIAETLNLEKKHMLEASQDFPENSSSVHMILGDINIVRSRRDMQFIFINGRPVQNKSISFHLNNLYRLILPQGQYPFFALYIQLPAENIDANIHPTKREVKIRDEQMLCALLRQMGEHTLMTKGKAKRVDSPPSTVHSPVQQALKETFSSEQGLNEAPFTTTIKYPQEPTEQYSFPFGCRHRSLC